MPRPTTKAALLEASRNRFDAVFALIDALGPQVCDAEFAFDDRDRNVRDVLVHLHEWHVLLLAWARSNLAGQPARFLPEPYTWADYSGLNVEIRDHHKSTSLAEAEALVRASYADVVALVESIDDDALFGKQHFDWTGSTSLGSYCVSTMSSHYDWAITKIRKHQRR